MDLSFRELEVLIDKEKSAENYEEIIVKPLEKGYGVTIGNSLRRILLNSIPGSAIIGFRIEGVNHELMSIPGTSNDTIELISSLKKLNFKMEQDEDIILKLHLSKSGSYYAKDINLPEGVEITNPDTFLLNATGKQDIEVNLFLRKSRGDTEAKEHKDIPYEFVKIDGLFSPVVKVGYDVNPILLDEKVSHEELRLFITTNGTIQAKESVAIAASIAEKHFSMFQSMKVLKTEMEVFREKEKERISIDNTTIEELNLSVRSTNALREAGVQNVGQLRKIGETELKDFKNMGKTSVAEVKGVLRKMDVQLGEY